MRLILNDFGNIHLFFFFSFFLHSHFQVREGNTMWKLYTLTNGRAKNVSHLCSSSMQCICTLCVLAEKRALASIHLRELGRQIELVGFHLELEFRVACCMAIQSFAEFVYDYLDFQVQGTFGKLGLCLYQTKVTVTFTHHFYR